MDPIVASLLGTLIGAFSGILGGFFASKYQIKLEKDKWIREQKEGLNRETREAIGEVAKLIAKGIHSIAWLGWKAKYSHRSFSEKEIDAYEKEMKGLFPDLSGARIGLAALDIKSHNQISGLIERLYEIDAELAKIYSGFVEDPETVKGEISRYFDISLSFDKQLRVEMANVLHSEYSKLFTFQSEDEGLEIL